MRKFLLKKIDEAKEEIQKSIVERINLGMTLSHYRKLDDSKKAYNRYNLSIKSSKKVILELLLELVFITSLSLAALNPLPLISKFCIGALFALNVISIGFFVSDKKKKRDVEKHLVDNGYDPMNEASMEELNEKTYEANKKYEAKNAYIDNLMTCIEDLKSMLDNNDALSKLEEYPKLLEEFFSDSFNQYLDERVNAEKVDLEPIPADEELTWDNPHQLKLK